MNISVIFPWRAGDPDRQQSLSYVVNWYKDCFPEAEIIFADDDDTVAFNRGRALNIGVGKSKGDILIFADGDLIISHKALKAAVAKAPEVGMVVPFSAISYLPASATRRVLKGSSPFINYAGTVPFSSKSQGGCNIMTREAFKNSGGFDRRFRGWGFEDAAFSVMVRLYAGPMVHEPGHAVHLYHKTARDPYNGFFEQSQALCKEYEKTLENSKLQVCKEDKNYCIKYGYQARTNVAAFDDTHNKDEWQKEVYLDAVRLMQENGWSSVIDVGCGSGYKLVNYLKDYDTLGLDLAPTLKFLKKTYPERKWDDALTVDYSKLTTDLVISSDVIEHVEKPDEFVDTLLEIECNLFLISTPDRDYVRGVDDMGPPANIAHYREWNAEEFKNFLSLWFNIEEYRMTKSQGTLIALCTRKERF
jgi:SAM-dependent methyltransferase